MTIADATILRLTAPGSFAAAAIGDTAVRASWNGIQSSDRPVSVFPNMPPFTTFEISGSVYQAGQTPATGAINGAVLELVDGAVAGRMATSGTMPPAMPGYAFIPKPTPGAYTFLGIPPGTFTLRVSKAGYVTQQVQATVFNDGGPVVDFQLQQGSSR